MDGNDDQVIVQHRDPTARERFLDLAGPAALVCIAVLSGAYGLKRQVDLSPFIFFAFGWALAFTAALEYSDERKEQRRLDGIRDAFALHGLHLTRESLLSLHRSPSALFVRRDNGESVAVLSQGRKEDSGRWVIKNVNRI